jgi:hypothetical protein
VSNRFILPSRLQSLLRARDSSTAKVRYPTQPVHTNSFFRGLNLKPAKRSSCGRKVASINNLAPYGDTIVSSLSSAMGLLGPILEASSCRDRDGSGEPATLGRPVVKAITGGSTSQQSISSAACSGRDIRCFNPRRMKSCDYQRFSRNRPFRPCRHDQRLETRSRNRVSSGSG